MRNWTGWAAAALVAAGCGGSAARDVSQAANDEHHGEDMACAECVVVGRGEIVPREGLPTALVAEVAAQPADGPGFDGGGTAATGHFSLERITPFPGFVSGTIDTIERCVRQNGILTALLSGIRTDGVRFSVVITDHPELQLDYFAYRAPDEGFNLPGTYQVHTLDRCEPPPACAAGDCFCAESGVCERCPGATAEPHDHAPPDGDTTTPAPGDTATPPPDGTGTTPPGTFIPL